MESVSRMPHLARMDVSPANSAEPNANSIHMTRHAPSVRYPAYRLYPAAAGNARCARTKEDNGGTEVYLKAVYLRTLAAGKHTLTVQSAWRDMTADITITAGLKIQHNVTVNLNGHVLRYDEAADPDSIFRVAGGARP